MAKALKKPRSQRTTGLLMAVAFVLIAAGVTLYVAIGHNARSASAIIGDPPIYDVGAPPDAGDGSLPGSTNGRLQFADKKNPSRLQAELAYATLDPLGGGYYKLGQPRAWVYFRDGRVVYLQADSGRFRMPGRAQRPESGDLTGGVLWRMFNPKTRTDGHKDLAAPIDVDRDTPFLVGYTPSASFDATLLEISSDEQVNISWATGTFEAQGLLVRLNELRERIEVLKTGKGQVHADATSRPANDSRAPVASSVKPADPVTSPGASDKPETPASASRVAHVGDSTPTPAKADDQARQASVDGAFVGPPAPPAGGIGKEALYRCLISENVTLSQRGRTLTSDTLEIFARTINNQLPEGAIAPLAFAADSGLPGAPSESGPGQASDAKPAAKPASASKTVADMPASAGAPEPTLPTSAKHDQPKVATKPAPTTSTPAPASMYQHSEDDIVLVWSGPLVLTPAQTEPVPRLLADGSDFGVRFSTERPGGLAYMSISDPATKAVAVCSTIEYSATTRDLGVLNGPGVDSVSIFAPELGRATVPSIRVNLGTGVAHVSGAGVLSSLTGSGAEVSQGSEKAGDGTELPGSLERQITWREQADFKLSLREGRLTNTLEFASFAGAVIARDRTSSIAGDAMRAEFAPNATEKDKTAAGSSLRRLNVRGNVVAVAGEKTPDPRAMPALDPHMTADELDVLFAPASGSGDVEPNFTLARGNVVAATREAQISAGKLEARIGKLPSGETGVVDMTATENARFDRTDGVFAQAETIRADAARNMADLTGSNSTIGRGASRVVCSRARLDGQNETLVVHGPGRFEHTQLGTGAGSYQTDVLATWSKGMVYDNARGTIDSHGEATFGSSSIVSVQKAAAEQMRIVITPGSGADKLAREGGEIVSDRRVLRAEAIGAAADKVGAPNAKLESYRYSAPTQAGVQGPREQVLYIEGPRVIYDNAGEAAASAPSELSGTFSVPGAGFAVVRDERAALATDHNAGASANRPTTFVLGSNSTATRGTSRLAWNGSMHYGLASGVLTMQRDVELAHLPPGANKATRLVASTINATFGTGTNQGASIPGAPNQGSQLIRAEAAGAVYAETGPAGDQQKMFSDHFNYDALAGKAEAWADDHNRVTFYQDKRPTPVVAKRLLWDLISDRVEITEPAPVIAPR